MNTGSPLQKSFVLHIITIALFCIPIFGQTTSNRMNNDEFWQSIRQCRYENNPITHTTVKFSNGKTSILLKNNARKLTLSFSNKTQVAGLTKDSIPGMGACLDVDSGNGERYSYLVAFLQKQNSVTPAASVYLGKNITVKYFNISNGHIEIYWIWPSTQDDTIQINCITCRNFSIINNQLIDENHEEAVKEKLKIAYDTIYTHSVKTGMWNVKWNTNRADAFNSTTGDTTFLYCTSREDLDDNNEFYGDADSDLSYFQPYWYSYTDCQMLSIVGPYVSFFSTYDGSGGVHPIYGHVLNVCELGRKDTAAIPDTSTAPCDTEKSFEKMIRTTKNLREVGSNQPKITDIFPENDVFQELMKDSIILAHLHQFTPRNLQQLCDSLEGECEIDFSFLLESFAIKSIRGDTATILFGLTHGCEVEKGNFTTFVIKLSIPAMSKRMFEEVKRNKTTLEDINPLFIAEQDSINFEKYLAVIRQNNYIDSVTIADKKKKESVEYFNKGNKFFEDKKYNEAIVELTRALTLYPDDLDALRERFISCANVGNWEQVMIDCDKSINIEPSYSLPHYYRALCYQRKRNFTKAIDDYNHIYLPEITVEPTIFYVLRAAAYSGLKKYTEAIQDLNKAIQEDSSNIDAYFIRGNQYLALSNFNAALKDYQQYRTQGKDSPGLLSNMGYAYSGLNNYDEAISYFTKSISADGSNVDPKIGMSIVYFLKGDSPQAIRYINEAISIFPKLENGLKGIIDLEQQGYSYTDAEKKHLKNIFLIREKSKK